MTGPVVNLGEVAFDDVEENGRFTSRRARFSDAIGARKLGYNLTVLPPGKVQCPFHSHHGEEEMFLILEGEGELRFGAARYPLRPHDVIACPTGGAEVAHQIINTGTVPMRYLAVSTRAISTCASIRTRGRCRWCRTSRAARAAGDVPRRGRRRLLRRRGALRRPPDNPAALRPGRDAPELLEQAEPVQLDPVLLQLAARETADDDDGPAHAAADAATPCHGPRWVACQWPRQTPRSPAKTMSSRV